MQQPCIHQHYLAVKYRLTYCSVVFTEVTLSNFTQFDNFDLLGFDATVLC